MLNGFSVYYIESNLVCVLVFMILLIHNYSNIDRQDKQVKFDRVLMAFILYFLTDCFWAAIVDGFIPRTRFSKVTVDFLIYLFMAAIIYFWLEYVMAFEKAPHRNRPINRFAVLFPFLASTIALILNYLLAPQFLLNDQLDTLAGYNIYLVLVPCIYMAAILFYTLRKALSEESMNDKRKHLFIGFFPLITIIGGVVETLWFPQMPFFCFCALILMLIFYIQSIELRISLDPLTQLNNRGQLTKYSSQRANLHVEGRMTYVIMIDIDSFKQINDTYGHAEGDKALVLVSDALKKGLNRHGMPSFLGRYGGDEFILIIHPVTALEAELLIREIREEVAKAGRDVPYPLSISVGCAELESGEETIKNCIVRADDLLYQDKKAKGAGR